MGRITTNIGLISGFPIADTVNQLMVIAARPRDLLEGKNEELTEKQIATTDLTAQLISLQIQTNQLNSTSLFSQRTVTSSDKNLLSVTSSGKPPLGSYQFTAVQQVQSHQLMSSKLASDTEPLGTGTFSMRFGGFVDDGLSLDLLGGGTGIDRGSLRITDRSGSSAVIDLRYAKDVDDVLEAINSSLDINVTAVASGDVFQLIDNTGQTVSNLKVEEVNGGGTAASLGLSGIDVAATSATGNDIASLFDQLVLNALNDGNGIRFDDVLNDLAVTFRDGTSLEVDFRKLGITGTQPSGTTDAVNGVNAEVTISADEAGSAYDGVSVTYQNDPTVTAGNETATYDEDTKTIIIKIDEGATQASHVVDAINDNESLSDLFTASLSGGSGGIGLVTSSDNAVLRGAQATATTPGTLGIDSVIKFSAVTGGEAYDDVSISFVHSGAIAGDEVTAVYNDTDPQNKTLTFTINEAETTANDVADYLNNNAFFSQIFTAEIDSGGNGTGLIDVAGDTAVTSGGAIVEPEDEGGETSLADVLATLNAVDPAKLSAQISADGERIELTDLTSDTGGSFTVTSINGSSAAEDLGFVAAASGDTIAGKRLLSGLQTTLVSSLGGGNGLTLGQLDLTDRSGASASVDLSSAVTLDDVIETINASGLGITATINHARSGIRLTDTTGATASNLIVANGDAANTADALGIATDAATDSVEGSSLQKRFVGENTLLSSLNGGAGVSLGTIVISDTLGNKESLNITSGLKTVGDVIEEIKRLGLAVDVRINDEGDGILLVDTADGSNTLTITEGNSTAGRDLRLVGEAETVDISGTPTQVINGRNTIEIELDSEDSLQDLVDSINELNVGVNAAVFNDGSLLTPFRFSLTSQRAGQAGELAIDASAFGFTLNETVAAEDALLLFGTAENASAGILASSSTNTFTDVLQGTTITINEVSEDPVSISVATSDSDLVATVLAMVDTYNRIRDRIEALTSFDADTGERGILQGDGAVLRVDSDLSRLITGRFFDVGPIQSLAQLGIEVGQDGRLSLEQDTLKAKFADDPDGVKSFLSSETTGFSDKFGSMLETLIGVENSVLVNRTLSISQQIGDNATRIDFLTDRLEAKRNKLLRQFINMELAIGKMQSDLSAISSIAPIAPL